MSRRRFAALSVAGNLRSGGTRCWTVGQAFLPANPIWQTGMSAPRDDSHANARTFWHRRRRAARPDARLAPRSARLSRDAARGRHHVGGLADAWQLGDVTW